MPNHITNWVQISGTKTKMDKLKKATLTVNEDTQEATFDFNGIIKMPDEVKRTGSGSSNAIVKTQAEADKINKEQNKSPFNEGIDTWAITEAEHKRRIKKYGAYNWYDWANLHWGTKWGAYDCHLEGQTDTTLALQFNTAWSPPEPIFDELKEQGFEVDCFWQDEDPSNSGEYGDPYEVFDIDLSARVEYLGARE